MAKYDWHRSICILAYNSVLKSDDRDYNLRRIFRWYSEKFHTPLHKVDSLPLEDVLTHYYESIYEAMSEEDLEQAKDELLETEVQATARIRLEHEEKTEADEYAKLVEKEENLKKTKPLDQIKPGSDTTIAPIRDVGKQPFKTKEVALPISKIEPEIHMTFMDPEDFEREIESFGLLDQPKKKQS